MITPGLQSLLQRFFTDRLLKQLGASPHTIAAYRDAFRLLLRFASEGLKRRPSQIRIEDLDVALLGKFLNHLEVNRGNQPRTRNNRLAAIHAFFQYVAVSEPALALQCQRVLAIPPKRYQRRSVEFLAEEEAAALLASPNPETWIGRRDRALLLLAIQTGLRNSEIRALRREDVQLGVGAHLRCFGKGRKMRCTPLRPDVSVIVKEWMSELHGGPDQPLFPSANGSRLSADALQRLVAKHVAIARRTCPSLRTKKVTPHTLRHGAAMALLRGGVDLSVIALWLGHESTETTQVYLHADMKLKEKALARTTSSRLAPHRFKPRDPLLAFLEAL
jgi:site-specific recombinase XerD